MMIQIVCVLGIALFVNNLWLVAKDEANRERLAAAKQSKTI